jgi:alpha-glucosidase/alpha-D-xyloside xylohydrolase
LERDCEVHQRRIFERNLQPGNDLSAEGLATAKASRAALPQDRLGYFLGTLLVWMVLVWAGQHSAGAGPVLWAGAPCEISLGEVSDKTAQLVIAPLDQQGQPRPIPPSAAFLSFPIAEKFRSREFVGKQEAQVANMRFAISAHPLTISVHRADGSLVQELVLEDAANGAISFHIDAPVYGLGEGEHQFDRRGTNYEMISGQHAFPGLLATHGATIPVPFLMGADGWAMFVRGPWGQFDLRGQHGVFVPSKTDLIREPLTVYISALAQPAGALAEYVRLTGHPVMPPKWVMGYMQSHRTLLDAGDALQIAREFRERRLPCDAVIYLGTGYCPLGWNLGHGSLEFNPRSFPQPAEQIKALRDLNLKVVLHINAAPRDLFGFTMTDESTSPFYIGNYWKRHLPDIALGVDAWWPDDGDELPIESRLARHLCYYEGPLQARPNVRPWSLHRNAYAGASRYGGWIWSGDTQSRWATLSAHVPVGLNSSLSLTPFWGSDIGGFVPTRELTGELYARWFEFAAFNPLFRSHGRTWHLRLPWGWNTGEMGPIEARDVVDCGELHNEKIETICRQYLELRYRLLPYNYTLMRESFDLGLPAMRALWLHYPKDAEAAKLGDEYLWGRDLLIAPVVEKAATNRHLYLPAGTWHDWWTGAKVEGGKWVDRPLNLATMPIYARAGAIIPLDPVRQFTAQVVAGPTTLLVYPGADGDFTLYDDDGQGLGYRDGSDLSTIWIHFHWNDRAQELTLEPDTRMKKWPGPAREYAVELAGVASQARRISFVGDKLTVK